MAEILCTQCGKAVGVPKPISREEAWGFVCNDCCAKNNAKGIAISKAVDVELRRLDNEGKQEGKDFQLADVVQKVTETLKG